MDHFCHLSSLPFRTKEAPSGCVISSGFRSARSRRPGTYFGMYSPMIFGFSTEKVSSISSSSALLRSTMSLRPLTGLA